MTNFKHIFCVFRPTSRNFDKWYIHDHSFREYGFCENRASTGIFILFCIFLRFSSDLVRIRHRTFQKACIEKFWVSPKIGLYESCSYVEWNHFLSLCYVFIIPSGWISVQNISIITYWNILNFMKITSVETVHTYIHIHTYIHTYIHTHTYKRRPLASREKGVSEQIPKTDRPFYKLHWLWKYVIHQYVQTQWIKLNALKYIKTYKTRHKLKYL